MCWMSEDNGRTCPNCGAMNVAKILYGLPDFKSPELRHALEQKRIVLGGCLRWDGEPTWYCNSCRHTWGGGKERSGAAGRLGREK